MYVCMCTYIEGERVDLMSNVVKNIVSNIGIKLDNSHVDKCKNVE